MARMASEIYGFGASVSSGSGTITNQGFTGSIPAAVFADASPAQGYRFSHWTWTSDRTASDFVTSQLESNANNPHLVIAGTLIDLDRQSSITLNVYAHFVAEEGGDGQRYAVITLLAAPMSTGKVSLNGSAFRPSVSEEMEVGETFRAVASPAEGYRLAYWESSLGTRVSNNAGGALVLSRFARQTEVWFAHFERGGPGGGLILRDESTGVILRSAATGTILREGAS